MRPVHRTPTATGSASRHRRRGCPRQVQVEAEATPQRRTHPVIARRQIPAHPLAHRVRMTRLNNDTVKERRVHPRYPVRPVHDPELLTRPRLIAAGITHVVVERHRQDVTVWRVVADPRSRTRRSRRIDGVPGRLVPCRRCRSRGGASSERDHQRRRCELLHPRDPPCLCLPRGKTVPLGALGRIRTVDTRFRKAVLYPLSYEGLTKEERSHAASGAGLGSPRRPSASLC